MSLLELRLLVALAVEISTEIVAAGFDAVEDLAEVLEGFRQRLGL